LSWVLPWLKAPKQLAYSISNNGREEPGDNCDFPTKVPDLSKFLSTLLPAPDHPTTLMCLGPLTNLATALRNDPRALRGIILYSHCAKY
jgi:inosine-uridine nucleoside N-ribohydrolase